MRAVVVEAVILVTILVFSVSGSPQVSRSIKLKYTAALTGDTAHPCHIVVYQPADDTMDSPKPEHVVVYDYSGNHDGKILWQCYRDKVFLEYADLLQYYAVTKIEFADVDSDGIDEAVISWDSDCAGSGWIQTLEVLDYDLPTGTFRSYKGITAAGPFGGFKVVPLNQGGGIQRIFAYSYVNDGMSGEECRWCPHRYRIAVYMLTQDGLIVDPHWNNGKIAYSQLRFPCDASGNPTDPYHSLTDYYVHSSLYSALETGPPFVVLSPQPSQTVSLPFSLRVEIPQDVPRLGIMIISTSHDGNEKILLDDIIDGWASEPSTSLKVEDSLYYSTPSSSTGRIVLYDPAYPDDHARRLSIPLVFEPVDTVTVKVYFPNKQRKTDPLAGKSVYPVERTIPATDGIARAALMQLFRGPTGSEKEQGFFTYLGPSCRTQDYYYPQQPCANKLKGLEIEDGIAQVWTYDIDWDELTQDGNPHAMEIASLQIELTLLQFSGISRVVIHRPQ